MLLIRSLLAFAFLVPGLQKRLRQVSKTTDTPIQSAPASWCPYLSHTCVKNAVNSLRAYFKLLISYLLEHTHSSWEGTAKPPKNKTPAWKQAGVLFIQQSKRGGVKLHSGFRASCCQRSKMGRYST